MVQHAAGAFPSSSGKDDRGLRNSQASSYHSIWKGDRGFKEQPELGHITSRSFPWRVSVQMWKRLESLRASD